MDKKAKPAGAVFTPRKVEEAHDELRRELGLRDRCYPGWVEDGRLARTDARDRYDRLKSAIHYLEASYPAELVRPEGAEGEGAPF
jgi:hypothetical protein